MGIAIFDNGRELIIEGFASLVEIRDYVATRFQSCVAGEILNESLETIGRFDSVDMYVDYDLANTLANV